MSTPMHASPNMASSSNPLPAAFSGAMNTWRHFVQAIDSWLAARKRIADDRDSLARMSDRELVDIGMNRASVDFVAHGGGTRDYPY
jgi:uncharacterized protein YjiS (DUF1127 family)